MQTRMTKTYEAAIRSMTPAVTAFFGGICGVISGFIFEEMRKIAVERRMTAVVREETLSNKITVNGPVYTDYFVQPVANPAGPILGGLLFVMVAIVVVYCLAQRPRALLSTWIGFGAFGIGTAFLIGGFRPDFRWIINLALFAVIAYLGYRFFLRNPSSVTSLWVVVGISFLVVIASLSQLFNLGDLHPAEMRNPLTWLLCLAITIPISAFFGLLLKAYLRLRG